MAALAFAICSLNAAEDFLLDATDGDTDESAVGAVLADVVEALEGFASDVADDLCDAVDTFLGASPDLLPSSLDIDGFLNSPVTVGFALMGRAASVFEPYCKGGIPCDCRSGLGVLDLWRRGVPDGVALLAKGRVVAPCGVLATGALRDLMFSRPLGGVPWMVERGFL